MTTPVIIPTLHLSVGMEKAKGLDNYKIVVDTRREGFTKTVNRGLAKNMHHEFVCLLNDDATPIAENWLDKLVEVFSWAKNVGFVGPSGTCRTAPQNTGVIGDKRLATPVSHLAFFCVVIRTEVLRQVGLLDEDYIHYGSDIDLQLRAKKLGFYPVWRPDVYVKHEVKTPIAGWSQHDTNLLRSKWGIA